MSKRKRHTPKQIVSIVYLESCKLSPEHQHLAILATGGNLPYATLP